MDISLDNGQNLSLEVAATLMIRFVHLVDCFIFASSVSFHDLESEKNMPSGGILRQCLRLGKMIVMNLILK